MLGGLDSSPINEVTFIVLCAWCEQEGRRSIIRKSSFTPRYQKHDPRFACLLPDVAEEVDCVFYEDKKRTVQRMAIQAAILMC